MKKAVVLLSGGLDSATTLYVAKKNGYEVYCLIFDYGQRHKKEVESAKWISREAGCPYRIIKIELPWKGSSLLDKGLRIPKPANRQTSQPAKQIPTTYVPARNTIFLSFALSYAEAIHARYIFIGANALDYSGYPDCRPEYYKIFNRMIELATKCGIEQRGIRVLTPLINLKKSEIVKLGLKLGVPYERTWSCYKGGKMPCGRCDSCLLRAKGFLEAEREDPLFHEDSANIRNF